MCLTVFNDSTKQPWTGLNINVKQSYQGDRADQRDKKATNVLINQACKQLISFSLHASMKMRFREQYIVQICSFLSEQSQRQLISWITATVSAVALSR